MAGLLLVSGCPDTSSAVNWADEQLDTNPSYTPVAVRVQDMDGDGRKDVVSLWRGTTSRSGAVVIHYQEEDGSWTTSIVHPDTRYANANALTLADMNQDTHVDIVVAAHDRITLLVAPAAPRVVADWKAFDITASMGTDFKSWYDVAVMQIDGVNGLDIVGSLNDVGRLVWFAAPADVASSDGWTIHSIDSTTRSGADSLQLVDLSDDGRLDVVSSATGDSSGVISWYEQPINPAAGTWPKHIMTSFAGATRFALGDLDGDGAIDLAAISPSGRRVAWFPHPTSATGVWNGWVLYNYKRLTGDEREPVDITLADIDQNGTLDVVVADASPASLFWYTPQEDNRLEWNEHRVAAYSDINYGFFAVDDVKGTGLPDVIVPVDSSTDNTLDRIVRYINYATPG
jgi:hypothetical protein